jgi:hypothetical protein
LDYFSIAKGGSQIVPPCAKNTTQPGGVFGLWRDRGGGCGKSSRAFCPECKISIAFFFLCFMLKDREFPRGGSFPVLFRKKNVVIKRCNRFLAKTKERKYLDKLVCACYNTKALKSAPNIAE